MDDLLVEQKKKEKVELTGCGHFKDVPHTCPFKTEIDNDFETLCTCCQLCENECARDV